MVEIAIETRRVSRPGCGCGCWLALWGGAHGGCSEGTDTAGHAAGRTASTAIILLVQARGTEHLLAPSPSSTATAFLSTAGGFGVQRAVEELAALCPPIRHVHLLLTTRRNPLTRLNLHLVTPRPKRRACPPASCSWVVIRQRCSSLHPCFLSRDADAGRPVSRILPHVVLRGDFCIGPTKMAPFPCPKNAEPRCYRYGTNLAVMARTQ